MFNIKPVKMHVFINDNYISRLLYVLSGFLQRSVLGPLLFLVYINDLDDNITSNVLKFADDTNFFRRLALMVINNIYKTI